MKEVTRREQARDELLLALAEAFLAQATNAFDWRGKVFTLAGKIGSLSYFVEESKRNGPNT